VAAVDPIAYWNNEGGARWKVNAPRIAAIIAPITARLLRFAAARPGERILDTGCGCAGTMLELARRAGPTGRVVGLDVSATLLGVAEEALAAATLPNVRLILADAATYDFGAERFDLVFSQFGVMFFRDPVAAFANLRGALAPGGGLAFACWRDLEANPFFSVPLEAATPFSPPLPPAPPDAPGPLAFCESERIERILGAAGFSHVQIVRHDEDLLLGKTADIDATARESATMGPTARLLADADPDKKEAAIKAIAQAYRRHAGPSELRLGAGIWLVSAAG